MTGNTRPRNRRCLADTYAIFFITRTGEADTDRGGLRKCFRNLTEATGQLRVGEQPKIRGAELRAFHQLPSGVDEKHDGSCAAAFDAEEKYGLSRSHAASIRGAARAWQGECHLVSRVGYVIRCP